MRAIHILSVGTLVIASLAAHADTTIDFNGAPTSGSFSSYTESGFTVSNTTGQYSYTSFGNPSPSIFETTPSSVTVTDAGATFNFLSVDLANDIGSSTYTFIGMNGATTVFDVTGTGPADPVASGIWHTFASGESSADITSLIIETTGADENVDNIVLSPSAAAVTPEPSSIALFATAILGTATAFRRRRWIDS